MKKHSHPGKHETSQEPDEAAEPREENSAEPVEPADPSPAEAPDADPLSDADAAGAAPETEAPLSPEEILQDRLLRLQADFDNYRKRIDRDKKDWAIYANEKLLKDLLPALDNFDLGLANGEKAGAPQALLEGLQLVRRQLESALANSGVTPIDAEGQPFDPNLHEAITHMPSPDIPEGTVAAQTRRGWKMGDKLLRAAQVVVSSGPAA
jgi:molecular chaperone GrpE